MNTKYYKKYIEKLINTNPVDIIIERKVTIPDGYGGTTSTTKTINAIVTLYDKKGSKQIVTDEGVSYIGVVVTKLLALNETDIIEGDTFKVDNKIYKVSFIKSYMGICKQGELEVIA
ncbi:hypothetical protein GOQ29_14415 [Clostridium sp. D2Q-14]|uniref:hypothetical protein n=1 Tax=Anaeromonas gelatinilytica TaxID=2683194 RepID=UPI00193BAA58|nr:hypothetical protein [Anaeromonas gelatinilytica]MBS4536811.1 hypothetical protein [Anaeromonas gelatinilytica]